MPETKTAPATPVLFAVSSCYHPASSASNIGDFQHEVRRTVAYRSGTYVIFHAAGTSDPTASDMKYYNLLRAWRVRTDNDFRFVNSHEKAAAVRDSSKRETLRRALVERLGNSKNVVLILGETTRFDQDWVPFEIVHAIDVRGLPIIAAYPGYDYIQDPAALAGYWPAALATRIQNGTARAIHIPFKQEPLTDAVRQFSFDSLPTTGFSYYSTEAYASFGVTVRS